MNEREQHFRQPQRVSKPLSNYLNMTAPRRRPPNENSPPRRNDKESARPVIDNRGLTLEEGNDFA
jgi:hypothetical protein